MSQRFPNPLDLSSINGINGFVANSIVGRDGDAYGGPVSGAGDINGDGINDLIIGAPNASPNSTTWAGQAYVIFGTKNFPSPFDLSSLNGVNGFIINGIAQYYDVGRSVSGVDINDDGISDLIIGANHFPCVIFGRNSSSFSSPFDLSSLNGVNGFSINASGSLIGAPDVNGDGINDLIIGAAGGSPSQAYVIFGAKNFPPLFQLTSLNGTNGFIINGIGSFPLIVSGVSDIDGDKINDIIIGEPGAIQGEVGQAYVIFGAKNFPSTFQLSSLNGTDGFIIKAIDGINTFYLGTSVSSALDINADGINDIVIGDYCASAQNGQAYVIFGSKDFSSPFQLSSLNGTNGFIVNGVGHIGWSVSGTPDINGDKIDDLIIGTAESGKQGYVVFGAKNFASTFQLSSLNGINGFIINGNGIAQAYGVFVNGAYDINADDVNDLTLGYTSWQSGSGRYYVIFGNKNFDTVDDNDFSGQNSLEHIDVIN